MNPPRVFISYSHDSAIHKGWVLDFATTLRNRGIDAVLDQWDLTPGDDLPHFMETELAQCDYVIMVCSEIYVEKANAGEGGVGYEKMIITSSLMKNIDGNKIIPVIRQEAGPELPTFLKTKLYIDFSNDSDVEYSLDELLRTLLKAPLFEKPEIGTNPFKPLEGAKPDRSVDGIKGAMSAIAAAFEVQPDNALGMADLMNYSDMHRLKLENYLNRAVNGGLLEINILNQYSVTEAGFEYLVNHGIIEP
ncbi:MAG: toll/interleukin-1 receptor domain-containing protein [Candidatus Thiodiazotropha lotti]|nr:toll/interleukin-1 receptor domain-containing protein [Candidatus Thiodiazotropha lotti]MCW4181771.1 toll/interleukin-1 receptor domain-containing protein [Candidatus Thiodiazotropha weberae]